MTFDELDGRFRALEKTLDQIVPQDQFLVARLDGRGFSKLTNETMGYNKPFDDRFHDAMLKTCEHLMQAGVHFTICYTQSDEISLLFKTGVNSFNGKTRKLNSVLAGEASGVFSLAIGHPVSFDCRLCPLPTTQHVIDYFCWRIEDGQRNALNAFCYWAKRDEGLSARSATKQLDHLGAHEKRALLQSLGIDFVDQVEWKRRGALSSWKEVPHEGENPLIGKKAMTTRRKLTWLDEVPNSTALGALVHEVIQ